MKKEFGSEPVINGKCLKTKLKCYNGKINTNFIDDIWCQKKVLITFVYQ